MKRTLPSLIAATAVLATAMSPVQAASCGEVRRAIQEAQARVHQLSAISNPNDSQKGQLRDWRIQLNTLRNDEAKTCR